MPGADGLRDWSSDHGPIRALVAARVAGVSSIMQRGHGWSGRCDDDGIAPQYGQHCRGGAARAAGDGPVGRELLLSYGDFNGSFRGGAAPGLIPALVTVVIFRL